MEALYLAILVGTLLVLLAAFSSLLAFRFGTPLLLVFLCIGLLAGDGGLGLEFHNGRLAYFVGSLALAIILFDSGFGTSFHAFRQAAAPAVTLATFGVLMTAGLFGLVACLLFGFPLVEGLLLGSIVASTDAAAVFFLLRIGGITVRDRVRSTLEVESGSNDPMAIFLTIALVGVATTAPEASGAPVAEVARLFVQQMGLGIVLGLPGGMLIVWLANRLDMERGLAPIFVVALALLVFSVTGALGGSGFLAVYIAGLYAGNRRVRHQTSIRRFQEGMTWLAQIVMFLVLGLLATPSQFPSIAVPAVTLAVFLIVVARPVAVWLCLMPYRFTNRETLFISWVGLRGAVSILLAILPVIGGVEGGMVFFNTAFIIVLVSLLVQGWTIGPVARRLGLVVPPRIGPVQKIEVELPGSANHELVAYRVVRGSPVLTGERLPRWARPSLVVRDGRSMRYQYAGRLQENDYVYLFISPAFPHLLDRLFASPAPVEEDDAEFFGAFAVDPRRPLAELEAAYGPGLVPEQELHLTLGEFLKQRFGGAVEYADRLRLGPLEIVVRDVDEKGDITSLGVSLDPEPLARPLPAFLNRDALADLRQRLRGKRRKKDADDAQSRASNRQSRIADPFALVSARLSGILRHRHKARLKRRRPMASFKTLDDLGDVSGKRVLLRVDLNVPVENGKVTDKTRIERVAPTIDELSGRGAKVILLAHFGRPKGKPVPDMSLKAIVPAVEEVLGHPVLFAEDCIGDAASQAVAEMTDGQVLLLENTRFHAGEEKNDPEFARALAANGDIYVNDAFSAAHRAHASTEGLAHLLPAYAGRTMQAELEALEKGLGNPVKPVLAIVGGAKVSTKIDLLKNLVTKVDALVIGGGMANTFLAARGADVGKSLCEHDLADTAREIMAAATKAHCAIVLPTDAVVAREFKAGAEAETVPVSAVPADAMILDVGPQTVEAINAWIGRADTLVWNGPLGAFEIEPFDNATIAAARYAAERTRLGKLVSVAGGGDTVAALNKAGVADDFTYVSTAGGAFLEWMEGKPLPGVEVLKT